MRSRSVCTVGTLGEIGEMQRTTVFTIRGVKFPYANPFRSLTSCTTLRYDRCYMVLVARRWARLGYQPLQIGSQNVVLPGRSYNAIIVCMRMCLGEGKDGGGEREGGAEQTGANNKCDIVLSQLPIKNGVGLERFRSGSILHNTFHGTRMGL